MKRTVTLLVTAMLWACGPGPTTSTEPPPAAVATTTASAGQALTSVQQTLVAADAVLGLNSGLNPDRGEESLARQVGDHAQGQGQQCGSVSFSGASVTANYGPPPGCTLRNGAQVSGSASVGISKLNGRIELGFTFAALVVNGRDLDGHMSFSTTRGTTFSANLDLTSAGNSIRSDLTVVGAAGQFSLDGTAVVTRGTVVQNLTFNQVIVKLGDCYPSAGTMSVSDGPVRLTIAFDAQTPATGLVTVTAGALSWTQSLPNFGLCHPETAP